MSFLGANGDGSPDQTENVIASRAAVDIESTRSQRDCVARVSGHSLRDEDQDYPRRPTFPEGNRCFDKLLADQRARSRHPGVTDIGGSSRKTHPWSYASGRSIAPILGLTLLLVTGCGSGEGNGTTSGPTGIAGGSDVPPDVSNLPNVIYILADDIGWTDIGAFRLQVSGQAPVIPTPNLDRLASEGMMFTDAHTPDSVCAPTRFSTMTGSNPYRSRPGGTWGLKASSAFGVNQDHKTVGDVMQAAGYRTAFLGKMHLGGRPRDFTNRVTHVYSRIDFSRPVGDMMLAHGFHYSFGMSSGLQDPPYVYWENDRFKPIDPNRRADNSSIVTWTQGVYPHANGMGEIPAGEDGPGDVDWNSSQSGPILAQKAVDFIDDHLTWHRNRPFFLYYAPQAVHTPHTPPVDFEPGDPTRTVPVTGVTGGALTDMIYELDLQVGKILQKLDDKGILPNTLIMFTSDNGGLDPSNHDVTAGHDSTTGILRGYKAGIYEGGHRVPFMAHWGDGTVENSVIRPATVTDQLIGVHDLMATLYDLTGQAMEADQAYDSASILPLLVSDDPDGEPPVRTMFFQQLHHGASRNKGVRMDDPEGQWFYIYDSAKNPQELYDLTTDLGQTDNLLADYYAFTDIPLDHPQHDRVTAMRIWRDAHDRYTDHRTTAAINYRDPSRRTPVGLSR